MIGCILIKLRPQQEIKIQGRGGEVLYNVLLDVLSRENSSLAAELCQLDEESPLTVSPFLKEVKLSKNFCRLSPLRTSSFRITYLQEKFLEPIMKEFLSLSSKKEPIGINGGEFLVEKVDMQKSIEAGFTSYEKILSGANKEEVVILEFCTPTLLYQKKSQVLFPLPELVFSSLLRRWNLFSGVKIDPEVEADFNKIDIFRFRLKTEEVIFSQDKTVGFVGKVSFKLLETIEKDSRQVINALANFARYSCLGRRIAMGMGQVRRVE